MNKNIIFMISLILLVGIVGFVSADQNWFYSVGFNDYQLTVEVTEGWNLVMGFYPEFISAGSQITASNIKAVFMYSPDMNDYIPLYPKLELSREFLISNGIDGQDEYYDDSAGLYSYWVYVENIQTCNNPACEVQGGKLNKLVYTIHLTDLDNIQMKKGWNFVGINSKMIGEGGQPRAQDLAGTCNIEKSYFFNPEDQQWNVFPLNEDFSSEASGSGWVIKVSNDCKLGTSNGGNIPSVPNLPNDPKCTDSDGGLNYFVKGTVIPRSSENTFSDACTDSGVLMEGTCDEQGGKVYSYSCPNGCNNGACVSGGEDKGIVPASWRTQSPNIPSDEEILKRIKAQWKKLDVDKNGKITTADADYLLKYYSGLSVPAAVKESITANPSAYDFDGLNGFDGPTDSVYFGRAILYGHLTGCQDSLCIGDSS